MFVKLNKTKLKAYSNLQLSWALLLIVSRGYRHFKVKEEWTSGQFKLQPGDEDIHTANERRLKVSNNESTIVEF